MIVKNQKYKGEQFNDAEQKVVFIEGAIRYNS